MLTLLLSINPLSIKFSNLILTVVLSIINNIFSDLSFDKRSPCIIFGVFFITRTIAASIASGDLIGIYNDIVGASQNNQIGMENTIAGSSVISDYGVKNTLIGTGSAIKYGIRNDFTSGGTSINYGEYNSITGASNGFQYGNFNT